jgi:hypothetical protein
VALSKQQDSEVLDWLLVDLVSLSQEHMGWQIVRMGIIDIIDMRESTARPCYHFAA